MTEPTLKEREYYRAPAQLTVRYGPETPEARHIMAMDSELWATQSQLEIAARRSLEDASIDENLAPILDLIRWMDFKLDLVLYHLRSQQISKHFPAQVITTDISGSGIGFAQAAELQPGERIIMTLTLPEAPGQPLFAVGEVTRVDAQAPPGQAQAAVRLLEITESDQERIIRFNFHQQRKELARRAKEDSA
jgi:hypothetical protein